MWIVIPVILICAGANDCRVRQAGPEMTNMQCLAQSQILAAQFMSNHPDWTFQAISCMEPRTATTLINTQSA